MDAQGDPLPPGAVLRLGSVRLRHGGGVHSLVFTPGGSSLVSAGGDGRVRLWDAADGRQLRLLSGPPHRSTLAALSPCGKLLAVEGPLVAPADGLSVSVLDFRSGKALRQLDGHGRHLRSAAFSPDGKLLACSGQGYTQVWEVASGKQRRNFHDAGGVVAFSPDGKDLAVSGWTVGQNGLPGTWLADLASGAKRRSLGRGLEAMAFSPDSRLLLTGDRSGVCLWDAATGQLLHTLLPAEDGGEAGSRGTITAVAFSPRGDRFASGGGDGVIRLWDADSRKELRALPAHHGAVSALAFSPDGKALASGGRDGRIRLWDVAAGRERVPLDGHRGPVFADLSPDGAQVVTAGADGTVRLWDARTGRELSALRADRGGADAAAFLPDSKTILTVGPKGLARLWDRSTGREVRRLGGREGNDSGYLRRGPAVSSDGARLAFIDPEGPTVVLSEAGTGKVLRRIPLASPFPHFVPVTFSPDGKHLAVGDGALVSLWETTPDAKGKPAVLDQGDHPRRKVFVMALAYSPDGKNLASARLDISDPHNRTTDLCVWDVAARSRARWLPGPDVGHAAVGFSADGRLLAASGREEVVRLWELASGREAHRLEGHPGGVVSVAFSPDGRTCVTGGMDGTALVWALKPAPKGGKRRRGEARNLRALWSDLESGDAARAYHAGWALTERRPRPFPDCPGDGHSPGPDPRRHTFTRAERKRVYRNAMAATLRRDIHLHAWLFRGVRGYYRARRREAGELAMPGVFPLRPGAGRPPAGDRRGSGLGRRCRPTTARFYLKRFLR